MDRPPPRRPGRPRATTPEIELQACFLAKDHGLKVAAERTGFDSRTIARWMVERGLAPKRNPRGAGKSQLRAGFSYTLVFDDEQALELFRRFLAMCEAGYPEFPQDGDRVAEALRGLMLD